MVTSQTNFLLSLGWAVLNSLWQLALLWVVYQLVIHLYTKSSAAFRARLATAMLVAGFGWFITTFLIAFSGSNSEELLNSTASLINIETAYPALQKILIPASVVYLCLLIIPVSRFIKNYRYVQVIRKYGLEKANAEWRIFVKNISAHMNIRRKVKVWVSEFISSPVTVGWLKPVILLPVSVVTQLSTQQIEALLLHELAHIRRYDYLVNLIINFIRTILYFNPFVTAFIKIVEREREKSCDEMVLQFQYNPHEYATALLQLQLAASQPRTFVVAATGKDELMQRVELIMGMRKKSVMPAGRLAGAIAMVIASALIFSSMVADSSKKDRIVNNYPSYNTSLLTEERPLSYVSNKLSTDNNIPVVKHPENPALATATEQPDETTTEDAEGNSTITDAIIPAGFEIIPDLPELKKYQEEQVKQTIEASKKVLNNARWSAVEKELAELFSQQEKKNIRKKYQQQVEKFDWKNWEYKLKAAYDKVDWDRVNYQMNQAINMVRLDSLQQVYNDAVAQLDIARKELLLDSVKSIPDSDISLKSLDKKIKIAMTTLSDIKATKKKRIVHL